MKGQSATEQLITYGWAFGILVIIVGALIYSGALSAFGSSPDRCVFQNGFFCSNNRVYAGPGGTTLDFKLTNKLETTVRITGILCSAENPDPAVGYPTAHGGLEPVDPAGYTLRPEDSMAIIDLNCTNSDGSTTANAGGDYNGIIYIRYQEVSSDQAHPGYGNLAVDHMKMANVAGKIN